MKKGSIVTHGWLYRKKKIRSENSAIGIVVSQNPFNDFVKYENLRERKGSWDSYFKEGVVQCVEVMWQSGKVSGFPVRNLVEIDENE